MNRLQSSTASLPYLTSAQAQNMFSWSRFMILLVLLLMQLLTLLGMLWVSRTTSERALQTQAHSTLTGLVRVTADNTSAYLQSAADVLQLSRGNIASGQLHLGTPAQQVSILNGILNAVPRGNGAMIARPDGSFVFVRHNDLPAPQSQKFVRIIEVNPTRRVLDGQVNAAGQISQQKLVQNPYDPRTRPWYQRAVARPGQTVWTDPYVFASSQMPGITVASTLGGAPQGTVMAVDVRLQNLADLLKNLQVSRHGQAFIADSNGHAIAASRAWPTRIQGRIPLLSEVADPPLQQLLNGEQRLDIQGEALRVFQVGGERYAAVLRQVEVAPGMRWAVGVYAPESDFSADLMRTYRQQLWAILAFTLLSALLSWPLAFGATRPLAGLQRQATTDSLTGLANRASFLGYLQQELRQATPGRGELAVVMLDLDGFKAVNDSFGHGTGDDVLHAIGARLLGSVRAGDTLGRLGGDEFALILKGDTREGIRLRIENIIHQLSSSPVVVEQRAHSLGATAGIAFHDPALPQTSDELLARADKALMQGKRWEKGRVWVDGEGKNQGTLFD